MSKFLKVVLAILAFVAAIPILDGIAKFFMKNTRKYTNDEKFDL